MEESTTDRIKRHFRENKKVYLGIGIGLGVAGITYAIMRSNSRAIPDSVGLDWSEKTPAELFLSLSNSNNNTITTTVHNGSRGHSGFITRCLDTGELFQTQGTAARAFGISETTMTRHLNGAFPDANGYHFERVGVLSS